MKIKLKKTFIKDLKKVTEPQKNEVKIFLAKVSKISRISDMSGLRTKKLRGKKNENYYRIRFGNYRLGYEIRENTIIIYRILHRKEIYRYFP